MKKLLILLFLFVSSVFAQTTTVNGVPVTVRNVPWSSLFNVPTFYYQTLQSNTTSQTQRTFLNFSPNFSFTDLASPSRTTIDLANILSFGPGGSGAGNGSLTCNAGGSNFSQCGFIYAFNSVNYFGHFANLTNTPISQHYPTLTNYYTYYDYIDGGDRIEIPIGANAPLFLQPSDGNVGIGTSRAAPLPLTIPNTAVFDPSQLASTSLTNGTFSSSGTSWTSTGDCAFGTSSATCSFSAGTASTISQASGTLTIAGIANRIYKLTYTVSGVSGSPSASVTTSFANVGAAAPTNLYLSNGTHILYFAAAGSPGAFTISTTLTSGQAFTLTNLSLQQVIGGTIWIGGQANARTFGTSQRCSSTASPAVCGQAAAGVVQVAASTTSIVVDTTVVTTNSSISLTYSTVGISAPANISSLGQPYISAISGGTSFTITLPVAPTTNPINIMYSLVN